MAIPVGFIHSLSLFFSFFFLFFSGIFLTGRRLRHWDSQGDFQVCLLCMLT